MLDREGLAAAILAALPAEVPRVIMDQQWIPINDPDGLSSALIDHYDTHRDQVHAAFLCITLLQSTAGRKLLSGFVLRDASEQPPRAVIESEELLLQRGEPDMIAREIFSFLTEAEPSLEGVVLAGRLIGCAISLTPDDQQDVRAALGELAGQIAGALFLLSDGDPEPVIVDEMIELYRATLDTDRPRSTAWARTSLYLAVWLSKRFHRDHELADCWSALAHLKQVEQVLPEDPDAMQASREMRIESYIMLGEALVDVYDQGGGSADLLTTAIDCFERQRALLAPDSEYWALVHLAIGNALHSRYKATGNSADLDRASRELSTAAREQLPGSEERGGSLMNWASVLASRYRFSGSEAHYRQALDLYDAALERLPDGSHYWAAASMGRANALLDHFEIAGAPDDLAQALAYFEVAAEAFEPHSSAWALCQVNLANARSRKFDASGDREHLEQALRQIHAAIEVYRRLDQPRELASARVNYGIASRRSYELSGQVADFDQADASFALAAAALPAGTRDGVWCRTSWADAILRRYEALGNTRELERAEELYRAVFDFIPANSLEWARATLMLANVAFMRYLHARRRVDLEQALDQYRAAVQSMPAGTAAWARAQTALGVALLERHAEQPRSGALNEALACFTRALECFPERSLDAGRCMTNLASAYGYRYFARDGDDEDDLRHSIALYQAAAQLFPEASASRASRLHNAGLTYLLCFDLKARREDLDRATQLLSEATEIYRQSGRVADQHLTLHQLARCYVVAREWRLASEVLEDSIDALETQLLDLPTQGDQLTLVTRHGDAYQLMVITCLALAEQEQEAAWLQTAWEYAERARGRLTLQTIIASAAETSGALRGERAAALQEWALRQRVFADRLRAVASRGPGVSDVGPPDLGGLRELERSAVGARRRFDEVVPELAALRTIEAPDLAAVQACLRNVPDGALLLEFMVLPDAIQLFILDGHELHGERLALSEAELRQLTSSFRSRRDPVPDEVALGHALAVLGRQLSPVIESHLARLDAHGKPDVGRVPHLLLVPAGELHYWPLHALPLSAERPLVERVAIGVLPAAGALPELARRQPSTGPYQALVPEADPPLPFGRAQARIEAALLEAGALPESVVCEGTAATFETLVEARGGILGFSTHARVDLDEPERSSVQLSDGSGGLRWVSALEFLVGLEHVNAALLLLWGCHTHGSGAAGGDNWLGISRAFLSAGRTLIASLWSIDNRATLGAGIELAQGLQQGLTLPQALRRAALAVRDADLDTVEDWREQIVRNLPREDRSRFVEDWNRALGLPVPEPLRAQIQPFSALWTWAPYVTIGWPGQLALEPAMKSLA